MATIHPESHLRKIEKNHHSEAKIIDLFEHFDKAKTSNWEVFYSYSFKSKTFEGMQTYKDCEIDFLILIPDGGVFVFEIKGGSISKNDSDYNSTDYKGEIHKIVNPYEQAKTNYYALSDNVDVVNPNYNRKIKDYVGGYLVGLVDMNKRDFTDPLDFDGRLTYLKDKDLYYFLNKAVEDAKENKNKIIPTKDDINLIKKALLGKNFTYKYDLKGYLDTVNVRISQLTEEQKTIFGGLLDNKRCLIQGRAGTGKTVLSEILFTDLITNKKERVAYFSYNIFNADKVNEELNYKNNSNDSNECVCKAFLDYVVDEVKRLTNNEFIKYNESGTVYKYDEYLEKFWELGLEKNTKITKFSSIIIDEAQDLVKKFSDDNKTEAENNELIKSVLDVMLVGGIHNGKLYIFYDDNQNIITNGEPFYKSKEFGDDGARYTKFCLTKNCRNEEQIDQKLKEIKFGAPIKDLRCELIKYNNCNSEESLLESATNVIKELLEKGVAKKSIIVLYTPNKKMKREEYIASSFKAKGLDIKPYNLENEKKHITFTTTNKFKGLEKEIVIYLRYNFDKYTKFDYVTVSRAKAFCYIFNFSNNK